MGQCLDTFFWWGEGQTEGTQHFGLKAQGMLPYIVLLCLPLSLGLTSVRWQRKVENKTGCQVLTYANSALC